MDNSEKPILAALDVGSNSVRLLVTESRRGVFVPIHTGRITSRLYQGLRCGLLDPDAIDRTAVAIRNLAREARQHGASEVLAFGTSAMRDGSNRGELIQRAAECGVPLEVLSGEDEAAISYQGAAPDGSAGVIDIGGGSTELLCGENGKVIAAGSAQVGAVRLMEALHGQEDSRMMINTAAAAMESAYKAISGCRADRWIGLGGTITTLAAMQLELEAYDPEAIEAHEVTRASTAHALCMLLRMDMPARRQVRGMNPARADIMPFGLAILLAFFELTRAKAVYACDRDNLIGYLMKKRPETLDKPPEMG